jgi:hypothetical protein
MGWTSTSYRWRNFQDFMREEFNDDRHEIVDYALVNRSEVYAAYRITPQDPEQKPFVIGLVVLIKWYSQGKGETPEICWKEMSESMGPCYYRCPERILKLLSPLEHIPTSSNHDWARKWRAKCWEYIETGKRWRAVKAGDVIKTDADLYFSDGRRRNLFMVMSKKPLKFREVEQERDGRHVLSSQILGIRRSAIKEGFAVVGRGEAEKINIFAKEV